MSTPDRVAVVVVHGIADQRAGQTVREFSRLLCHGGDGAPRYVQGEIHQVLVPVEKLEPGSSPVADVSPQTPPVGKSRKPESARRMPGTPSGFYQMQEQGPAASATAEAEIPNAQNRQVPEPQDLGLALNDYLLGRLALSEGDALYESTRVSLRRRADDRPVDLYELYWADLSRLGTGGLQALSALYQLFFHLSTLAADVVDQVALSVGGGRAWRLLQRLHAWMAWLMKGPAALLQLSMLLVVLFGAAAFIAPSMQGQLLAALFGLGVVVLTALGALAWLRGSSTTARWAKLLLMLAAAVVSLAAALASLNAEAWVPRIYFGACTLGVALAGAYLVERYAGVTQGVRSLGHLLVAVTAISLCVNARALLPEVTTQWEWMLTAALHVGELLLAAMLLVWAVFVAVQVAALILGLWLERKCDPAARASMHTSRLVLVGSSALFAVLSLVLWSVVSYVAGLGLAELSYAPALFGSGYRSAAIFLEERVYDLGGFFTPLMAAFTLLSAAALLVLLPALKEEISPTANLDAKGQRRGAAAWAAQLGHWIGGGIRHLGSIFKFLVPVGAIAGSLLYLAFVMDQIPFAAGAAGGMADRFAGYIDYFRGETLVEAGKWLAGGALTVAALGSRFKQTFGRLRIAIDAVLDVDNYFGDPPNRQPPRARIYSRYASLLAYLRDRGYTRIVIVSHSQGTVISADLLRYLHVQRRLSSLVGGVPVALVTFGSPLRDLYAERFPLLYRWMGSHAGGFANASPGAADIGATEWVNACRSGDYVGRFLWTPPDSGERFRIAGVGLDGKVSANRAGDRTEFCLGAGGHTRYFSNDAIALAVEIDRLIAGAR